MADIKLSILIRDIINEIMQSITVILGSSCTRGSTHSLRQGDALKLAAAGFSQSIIIQDEGDCVEDSIARCIKIGLLGQLMLLYHSAWPVPVYIPVTHRRNY